MPRPRRTPKVQKVTDPTFHPFPKLPIELRLTIWALACPGPRLIEVYPRPRGRDFFGGIDAYKWRATKCACKQQCQKPLTISQVCREARTVFARSGKYAKCFGTLVNWEIDIVYLGGRVGHLHNAEFLKAMQLGYGLNQLRHLAIDEIIFDETNWAHGGNRVNLKRCSPAGLVQQLSALRTLTIVGRAGLWQDGNELVDSTHFFHEDWDDDAESEDDEDDGLEPKKRGECPLGPLPSVVGIKPFERFSDDISNENESDDDNESIASELIEDFWRCEYEAQIDEELRIYQPGVTDETWQRFGPTGHCGLALVDFESIDPAREPRWGVDYQEASEVRSDYHRWFKELKDGAPQEEEEHDDPTWHGYADYASYQPPEIKLALFRKTAPSCHQSDWSGLEKDFISFLEIDDARRHPHKYAKSKKVREHYPTGFKLRYDANKDRTGKHGYSVEEFMRRHLQPVVIKEITIGS